MEGGGGGGRWRHIFIVMSHLSKLTGGDIYIYKKKGQGGVRVCAFFCARLQRGVVRGGDDFFFFFFKSRSSNDMDCLHICCP